MHLCMYIVTVSLGLRIIFRGKENKQNFFSFTYNPGCAMESTLNDGSSSRWVRQWHATLLYIYVLQFVFHLTSS